MCCDEEVEEGRGSLPVLESIAAAAFDTAKSC